jgi:hypothetical protein
VKWDSEPWRELRDANLLRWMAGNADAVACFVALSTICETWDDLVDRDKPVGDAQINEAFTLALINLQVNPFYKANEALLYALIVAGTNAWMDANALQSSPDVKWRMLAFYLRNTAYELASICAFRAGGWQHLRAISLEMRQFFAHESYAEWEHRHEVD